jgi:hypothetical protein
VKAVPCRYLTSVIFCHSITTATSRELQFWFFLFLE